MTTEDFLLALIIIAVVGLVALLLWIVAIDLYPNIIRAG